MNFLSKATRKTLIFLIDSLRPLLGCRGCCRYNISCTIYAKDQLDDKDIPLYKVLWDIIKRVISCHPFHRIK
jgi:putative component of membrane protein insertase Oxa1/YidC/SpoIIIJ protein YidD